MPTVLEEGGFAIRIYLPPREHWPPHVHVIGKGGEVMIRLGDGHEPPRVREIYRMKDRDVVRAFRRVEVHHAELVAAWRSHHD